MKKSKGGYNFPLDTCSRKSKAIKSNMNSEMNKGKYHIEQSHAAL